LCTCQFNYASWLCFLSTKLLAPVGVFKFDNSFLLIGDTPCNGASAFLVVEGILSYCKLSFSLDNRGGALYLFANKPVCSKVLSFFLPITDCFSIGWLVSIVFKADCIFGVWSMF